MSYGNGGYGPMRQARGNYGGAGQVTQPSTGGPRVVAGSGGQQTEDFFIYGISIASIATNVTVNQQITIQADSNFEWVMSTVEGNLTGNTDDQNLDGITIPLTVNIVDGGSGRNLMSSPIPLSGIAGTGKQPFILPVPRMFSAKSTVTFSFYNFSANTWLNIYFNLIGRKIFDLG